jgi:hypothetical protein
MDRWTLSSLSVSRREALRLSMGFATGALAAAAAPP